MGFIKKVTSLFLVIAVAGIVISCSQVPAQIQNYSDFIFDNKYFAKIITSRLSSFNNYKSDYKYITVKKGDTISKLAKKYKTSQKSLISANKLRKPYRIAIGQKLKLPIKYKSYKVRRGDSLSEIAHKYSVNMYELAKINKLRKPYKLAIGQKLKLPSSQRTQRAKAKAPKKYKSSKKTISKKKNTKKISKSRSKQTAIPKKYSSSKKKFIWPTKGKLLSKYGKDKDGEFNDGINISAKEGTKIRASASGTVVYTGSELKGYGNLLIIRHNSGWMTAYAHNKSLAVKRGQKVKKGQIIGYVGKTGSVTRPQLHFAIRKGRNAVDPMKYL